MAIVTSRLAYRMLYEWFDYVVNNIKAPLQKAIETSAQLFVRKFGAVTKEQTCCKSVHSLLDIQEYLMSFDILPDRKRLINSAFTILEAELEHDPDYRHLFDLLMDAV
jgi:hypothetical protein